MENARPFSFWTGLTLLDITFCVVGGWVSYNKAAHSALLKSSKQYNADCVGASTLSCSDRDVATIPYVDSARTMQPSHGR